MKDEPKLWKRLIIELTCVAIILAAFNWWLKKRDLYGDLRVPLCPCACPCDDNRSCTCKRCGCKDCPSLVPWMTDYEKARAKALAEHKDLEVWVDIDPFYPPLRVCFSDPLNDGKRVYSELFTIQVRVNGPWHRIVGPAVVDMGYTNWGDGNEIYMSIERVSYIRNGKWCDKP